MARLTLAIVEFELAQGDGHRLVVLFAVVPNPNVLRRHPQHPASATPGSAPWRISALDQLVWPIGGRGEACPPPSALPSLTLGSMGPPAR